MASEPPDGISSVVSVRRVRIDGIVSVWVCPLPSDCVRVSEFSFESSDT